MISGQVDRLRTAAQTYRRLGNHLAESMLLDAADTIWKLRDDLQRTNADNAKLRELVSGLEHCSQGFPCNRCPLYDQSGTNHRRCESLERELGIEVTDG